MADIKTVSVIAPIQGTKLDSQPQGEAQAEGAQRSVESEATVQLTRFSPSDIVYFFTYFPYPKYEGISKLSDKLRRKFKKLFLVREVSPEGKKIHYHGLGISEKEISSFEMKGYCTRPWHQKITCDPKVVDRMMTYEEVITDESYKSLNGLEISKMITDHNTRQFILRYHSREAQIKVIIHYMMKSFTGEPVEYEDYILIPRLRPKITTK